MVFDDDFDDVCAEVEHRAEKAVATANSGKPTFQSYAQMFGGAIPDIHFIGGFFASASFLLSSSRFLLRIAG